MEKMNSSDTKKEKENNKILSSGMPQTFSSNHTQNYLKKINQNILKSIKNINEKKNINIYKKINIIKNKNILNKVFVKNRINSHTLKKNKKTYKKPILKHTISYYPKNNKRKIDEKDILSSLNFFSNKNKKDFSRVTSNINYLLKRNQTLLMREESFHIYGLNNITPYTYNFDKNIFKYNNFSSRNGIYGKEEKIPLIYELSMTHKNEYSSKSEKSRHELLLNELNKLKFYLEQNPNDEILIIKDFLQKFNIKHISQYSDEKLLYICKLICKISQNQLLNIIKPDTNIKRMIKNLLNISFDLNQLNNYNLQKYNSFYCQKDISQKQNLNKNKTFNNFHVNKRKKYFDIYDTNSKLKYLHNQKELYRPNKNYSHNFDLLINEISKEVKEIESNIKKGKEENKAKDDDGLFITQQKNKSFSSKKRFGKKLTLSPINHREPLNSKKGIFLVYTKNFANLKKYNKNNNIYNRILNICLRKKKIEKENDKGITIEEKIKKNKLNIKEIIKRLYYKPTEKKFGFNDIKKNLKITEYVALNFAKQRRNFKELDHMLNPYKYK